MNTKREIATVYILEGLCRDSRDNPVWTRMETLKSEDGRDAYHEAAEHLSSKNGLGDCWRLESGKVDASMFRIMRYQIERGPRQRPAFVMNQADIGDYIPAGYGGLNRR
jgi:hypothetical protein